MKQARRLPQPIDEPLLDTVAEIVHQLLRLEQDDLEKLLRRMDDAQQEHARHVASLAEIGLMRGPRLFGDPTIAQVRLIASAVGQLRALNVPEGTP